MYFRWATSNPKRTKPPKPRKKEGYVEEEVKGEGTKRGTKNKQRRPLTEDIYIYIYIGEEREREERENRSQSQWDQIPRVE